ncbi:putative IgGFc-binding protein [Apostichopus japonicus]|uniref:Putative IgGFc-binding protein n=1 Tax=Stichopus japonicus TaxID=307972 RepID=A0A2G8KFA4_STIJA|nr:putative IgGFc-binding protein [Apostichopus japonicus]
MECPVGMSLSTCAPACPPNCAEPSGPEECDMPCIEACVCPEGQLLDGTTCVEPRDCGCFLHTGEYISKFQEWTSPDCKTRCYCEGPGELQCRNYTCNENADCTINRAGMRTCECHEGLTGNGEICVSDSGLCQIWGDPHYVTFDGKKFDFQGGCQYTLVKKCKGRDLPNFHLIGDNKRRIPGERVSYQRELILRYKGHEYVIRRHRVSVDGVKVTPPLLNHAGVTVHYDVPFTTVETEFGLKFRYNQRTDTEVYLSNEFASKVCGLCGNFDGNKKNDFTKPNGQRLLNAVVMFLSGYQLLSAVVMFLSGYKLHSAVVMFLSGYKLHSAVVMFLSGYQLLGAVVMFLSGYKLLGAVVMFLSGYQLHSAVVMFLSGYQLLSAGLNGYANRLFYRLPSCHQVADSSFYYETCKYDLCATLPDQTVLCDSIEEFLIACREAGGEPGDWRSSVPQVVSNLDHRSILSKLAQYQVEKPQFALIYILL